MEITVDYSKTITGRKPLEMDRFTSVPSWIFWFNRCDYCRQPIPIGHTDACIVGIAQGRTWVFHEECWDNNAR